MLQLKGVNSHYGHLHVLWDIDLEVNEKTIAGIIGPNGAGKSTLLKTILGAVPCTSGTIQFDGEFIQGKPTKDIVTRGITYVPEGKRIFPELTVRENLVVGAIGKAHSEKRENLQNVYQLFPILKERRNQLAGTLSGGELKMLVIARGLMASPKLLMIDEPSFGLSPVMFMNVFEMIRRIKELGITIVVVEQNVPQLLQLATHVWVLENGRIVLDDQSEKLRDNEYITKSYLGI